MSLINTRINILSSVPANFSATYQTNRGVLSPSVSLPPRSRYSRRTFCGQIRKKTERVDFVLRGKMFLETQSCVRRSVSHEHIHTHTLYIHYRVQSEKRTCPRAYVKNHTCAVPDRTRPSGVKQRRKSFDRLAWLIFYKEVSLRIKRKFSRRRKQERGEREREKEERTDG